MNVTIFSPNYPISAAITCIDRQETLYNNILVKIVTLDIVKAAKVCYLFGYIVLIFSYWLQVAGRMTSEESEVTESVSEPGVGNPRRHRRRNLQNLHFKYQELNMLVFVS
jgi:hypothetical protein